MHHLSALFFAILFYFLVATEVRPKLNHRPNRRNPSIRIHKNGLKKRGMARRNGGSSRMHPFDIKSYMGSKAIYAEHFRGNFSKPPNGCELKYVDHINRHGTRYGRAEDFEKMPELFKKLTQGGTTNESLNWMSTWKNWDPKDDEQLHERGAPELQEIARKFIKNTNPLFAEYKEGNVEAMSSPNERAKETGDVFIDAAFKGHKIENKRGLKGDVLLHFHKECPNYINDIPKHLLDQQITSFWDMHKKDVQDSIKMATSGKYEVSLKEARKLFTLCAFQIALLGIENQACALFTQSAAEKLEFIEDLAIEFKKAYGREINGKMTTELFKDIMDKMHKTANGENKILKASFRFTHLGIVAPIYVSLGLFKDTPRINANYDKQQRHKRHWRSSRILPFAANIGFYLYKCGSKEHIVKIAVNEVDVRLPHCNNKVYFKLDCLQTMLKPLTDLDYKTVCGFKR